ncbi:hypothetical protein M440DRAFT_1202766 [Trichoderma longibrachiatum ATCC 18648]|uniref:Uncharacterized protein n=1 Tax=Trichoderma longibrachiatum ATCC 18648 TaxID=983965 RepID=A0A2T4CB89_TRILO|nr:hypothetical protein M440DRAFT_1202766 [Trichoderma longibrachiatum ATCC 18648]
MQHASPAIWTSSHNAIVLVHSCSVAAWRQLHSIVVGQPRRCESVGVGGVGGGALSLLSRSLGRAGRPSQASSRPPRGRRISKSTARRQPETRFLAVCPQDQVTSRSRPEVQIMARGVTTSG